MTYKSKISSVIAVSILCLALVMPCLAQRKITPVKSRPATGVVPTAERKKEDDKSHLAEMRDAQGNVVFVDTITGMEWVDSTANEKSKKMIYPRMESLTLGVNVWDPAMRLLGSDYGGFDVSAELSLYNRYKPVFEFGMGASDITPDGQNYTFHTPLSPYFKIGINYNFLFNSNPRYQLYAGIRYGFTPYKYEVKDVTLPPGYWKEQVGFDIPSQSATAGYFEFMAGVRVEMWKNISLGWSVKYHTILHESKSQYGQPMYIPGYGKRGGSFTGSFTISYTIPFYNREELEKEAHPAKH